MAKFRLETEEYVEQAYFFRMFRERLDANVPSQEILRSVKEEILATTKLPMAIDFLTGEIILTGRMNEGMARLGHYFSEFQTYIVAMAEDDYSKFDQRTCWEILQHEAEYRSKDPSPAGLFVFQFECLSRNKLGYERGMKAMSADPMYDEPWSEWILRTRLKLGTTDFADLIFLRSQYFVDEYRRTIKILLLNLPNRSCSVPKQAGLPLPIVVATRCTCSPLCSTWVILRCPVRNRTIARKN